VRDPSSVRVTGPLTAYAPGFVVDLGGRGYAVSSVLGQMKLVAHLSRWMAAQGVPAEQFSLETVERFVQARRAGGYRHFLTPRALAPLLAYLHSIGVVSLPAVGAPATLGELLIERYRAYLVSERGVAPSTLRAYLSLARRFIDEVASPAGDVDLAGLTAGMVSRFVLDDCGARSAGSAKNVIVALRSLLRFLHVDGFTGGELAAAVPSVAPHPRGLPRALPPGTVTRLLASCDRRSALGRRDFAVLMVLSRLGLRAGEVSAIELGDIDWRAGELLVRGKAGRRARLPLPVDVGEALAGYLQHGRPPVRSDRLFFRAIAPIAPLTSDAVSEIVRHACRRCGLPPAGAHRLRHTAATETLRAGGSLAEIGQLLRQQTAFTTAIYARVDRAALRELARAWPETGR
jgi:integrase/recombinase XerD